MCPYRNLDDSDEDSDDEYVVYVSGAARPDYETPGQKEKYPCKLCPDNDRPEFESYADLIEHKVQEGHHYCKKCDEDFKDRDDLELHLFNSNKHITCYLCCKEFKSESGLSLHMKNMHQNRAAQDNVPMSMCPQCHESFATKSALLQHLEGNLCPGGLRRDQVWKLIDEIQKEIKDGNSQPFRGFEGGSTSGWSTNGVQGPPAGGNAARFDKIYDSEKASTKPVPEEKANIDIEWYDSARRQWVCPHRSCRKKFVHPSSLEQHLSSGAHAAKSFLCPGCKKKFQSSSAMSQHMESGQCRITSMPESSRIREVFDASIRPDNSVRSIAQSVDDDMEPTATLSTVGTMSVVQGRQPAMRRPAPPAESTNW
ncbi:hypothetical protein TWF694_006993 [Orbilia ellipsospora]|uniref:C2H2-type domain-containing protein n=1 Tax=Orbilia ellipsospora TaxID=2528407 RepID=A0AAV9XLU4_9PEZI